jgi:hypothetical protein
MKKKVMSLLMAVVISIAFSSCATVFAYKSSCHGKAKAGGRTVRIVPVVLDVLTGVVWLGVDFADGAIYKPCNQKK